MEPISTAVLGVGNIGRAIVRSILREPGLALLGAVDSDPLLRGRPLTQWIPEAPPGLVIESELAPLLKRLRGGVLLIATTSSLDALYPILEAAARAEVHVVSTCEELAFPWLHDEARADALDRLAAKRGIAILGTGVNPGFVLDRLAAVAGGGVGPVRHLRAVRTLAIEPSLPQTSPSFHARLGLGLTEDQFAARAEEGTVGLRGLTESATLAALGLGLDPDEFEEELLPIIAEEPHPALGIASGTTAGLVQRVRAFIESREVLDLEVTCSAGTDSPSDRLTIDSEPRVELIIQGGYPRDETTAWSVVRAALQITRCEPGIVTVLDLPAGR